MFSIVFKDKKTKARTGLLETKHGRVHTPVFLPIGTKGTVKTMSNYELKSSLNTEMILANTYHLWVSPGDDLIAKAGGLHSFMNWDRAIFTDSGGYQLFSLGEKLQNKSYTAELPFNVKVSEEGVSFQKGDNGDTMMLTPERSVQIQSNLGSDVAVVLDEFTGEIHNYEKVKATVERTTKWAKRSKNELERIRSLGTTFNDEQIQLGIVQGGMIDELRAQSAREIREIGFDGYAIGGVAVGGESSDMQYQAIEMSTPYLEEEKYKHLLGVGTPEQIIQAVARGIDSFDCVIPTREARHGRLYLAVGPLSKSGYETIDIGKAIYKNDFQSLDVKCSCYGCKNHTKAYLHHLFRSNESLGQRLMTLHNMQFYANLMGNIRKNIESNAFTKML